MDVNSQCKPSLLTMEAEEPWTSKTMKVAHNVPQVMMEPNSQWTPTHMCGQPTMLINAQCNPADHARQLTMEPNVYTVEILYFYFTFHCKLFYQFIYLKEPNHELTNI